MPLAKIKRMHIVPVSNPLSRIHTLHKWENVATVFSDRYVYYKSEFRVSKVLIYMKYNKICTYLRKRNNNFAKCKETIVRNVCKTAYGNLNRYNALIIIIRHIYSRMLL